jgi:hypothetical protein
MPDGKSGLDQALLDELCALLDPSARGHAGAPACAAVAVPHAACLRALDVWLLDFRFHSVAAFEAFQQTPEYARLRAARDAWCRRLL